MTGAGAQYRLPVCRNGEWAGNVIIDRSDNHPLDTGADSGGAMGPRKTPMPTPHCGSPMRRTPPPWSTSTSRWAVTVPSCGKTPKASGCSKPGKNQVHDPARRGDLPSCSSRWGWKAQKSRRADAAPQRR